MGTNYYWFNREPCECCKRPFQGKHIGKSSAGWCFSLHVYPDEEIHDLSDWERRFSSGYIENEYGERVAPDSMLACIRDRRGKLVGERPHNWPNGLSRHCVDDRHCIGHGEGTWDLIVGDFS